VTSVVVDTNVFVSFLTDRDKTQQVQAEEVLIAASNRELEVVVHEQVLTELIYVLLNFYDQQGEGVSEVVRDLLALPGVCTIDALEWSRVFDLWPDPIPDFADAVLAATCRSGRHDAIATFDRTFKRRLVRLGLESYW
jgi:predicted nucleic acid-binding protein